MEIDDCKSHCVDVSNLPIPQESSLGPLSVFNMRIDG